MATAIPRTASTVQQSLVKWAARGWIVSKENLRDFRTYTIVTSAASLSKPELKSLTVFLKQEKDRPFAALGSCPTFQLAPP